MPKYMPCPYERPSTPPPPTLPLLLPELIGRVFTFFPFDDTQQIIPLLLVNKSTSTAVLNNLYHSVELVKSTQARTFFSEVKFSNLDNVRELSLTWNFLAPLFKGGTVRNSLVRGDCFTYEWRETLDRFVSAVEEAAALTGEAQTSEQRVKNGLKFFPNFQKLSFLSMAVDKHCFSKLCLLFQPSDIYVSDMTVFSSSAQPDSPTPYPLSTFQWAPGEITVNDYVSFGLDLKPKKLMVDVIAASPDWVDHNDRTIQFIHRSWRNVLPHSLREMVVDMDPEELVVNLVIADEVIIGLVKDWMKQFPGHRLISDRSVVPEVAYRCFGPGFRLEDYPPPNMSDEVEDA